MRTVVICDDSESASRQLFCSLQKIANEAGEMFEILHYSSGESMLACMPRNADIVLLDIGMEGVSGMEAAHCLRREGCNAVIIFVTSMPEYAIEGYEVHAFSFLKKPVQYAALRRQVTEALATLNQKKKADTIVVPDGSSRFAVSASSLLYAEVWQHHTKLVFSDTSRIFKISLSEIENQAAEGDFFRCHKSYLVNLRHVFRIDFDTVTVSNGDRIPLSKYRRKEFMCAWSHFVGATLCLK